MASAGSDDAMELDAAAAAAATAATTPPPTAPSVTALADALLATARAQLHAHLASHPVHQLVPTHSRVLIVDAAVPAQHALRALPHNDVRAAAVLHAGALCAMLTLSAALHAARDPRLLAQPLLALVRAAAAPPLVSVRADAAQLLAARLLARSAAPPLAVVHAAQPLHCLFAERLLALLEPRFRHAPFLHYSIAALRIGRYSHIVSADVHMPAHDAAALMLARRLDSLPVTAAGRVVGVLDADVLGAAAAAAAVSGHVCSFMQHPALCTRHDSLASVVEKLRHGWRRVFVVDHHAVVIGVIGLRHLLRFFLPAA